MNSTFPQVVFLCVLLIILFFLWLLNNDGGPKSS
jgi:hypothetical protein